MSEAAAFRAERRKRLRAWAVGVALLLAACLAILIAVVQERLIYCHRSYPAGALDAPPGVEAVAYAHPAGSQISFYRPPAVGGTPARIWLVCSGQGGRALDWLPSIAAVDDPAAGFLLLDYPGSGANPGPATPGRILAACEGAVATLGARLDLDAAAMGERLGVFGYSLGTGPALQYAARHRVRRIVLAAAYTSLHEMIDRTWSLPVGFLVWHRFDNEARLAEIGARGNPPPTDVVHGTDDTAIPVAMAYRLVAGRSTWATLQLFGGRDHNDIVAEALRFLAEPRP